MFLKLSLPLPHPGWEHGPEPIYINPKDISYIMNSQVGAIIRFRSGFHMIVSESAAEVIRHIGES
jgi:uncharacterized protein YlzI (FlbEa/FlbD family)